MTAPLPTPDEVAQMRERHVAQHHDGGGTWCLSCRDAWPCDGARLLALVDNQATTLDEDRRYMRRQDDRLHAVLAECDRLDGVTHLMGRDDENVVIDHLDRIRRAATGGHRPAGTVTP